MSRKYTKELLESVAKESLSKAEMLRKLGLKPSGGNNSHLKRNLEKFEVDISHFTGQGWSKGKKTGPKRPIEDYLSNKCFIKSDTLRRRLIKEGIFEAKCYRCNRKKWMGQDIPLELHHIDHDHSNNNLDNLIIVCNNCHHQIHHPKE